MEYLNKRFDPFDIKLDGWSESINTNITDYDEIFESLYDKYKTQAEVSPELKLMLMVTGSAFCFHLSNTFLKNSLPGMDQVLKQNPEIIQNIFSGMTGVNTKKEQVFPPPNSSVPPKREGMTGPSNLNDILNGLV